MVIVISARTVTFSLKAAEAPSLSLSSLSLNVFICCNLLNSRQCSSSQWVMCSPANTLAMDNLKQHNTEKNIFVQ